MKKFAGSIFNAKLPAILAVLAFTGAAFAQTQIKMPKNKYKTADDVKIGREASVEAEKQFPILSDAEATAYVQTVGRKLVAAIPPQFQQPDFNYTFKIINARDINAFALPGGPMYLNRGMIEAAANEGEMAGVMAHEIVHGALRHGTAQATKANNPLNQILAIGAIVGGAVVGGQGGAQLGQIFAAGYFLRYSRQYETQADVLGSQIMANAGYDPIDLANMFKTIAKQSGGGGAPEWLSSHPDPENRFKTIEKERSMLRVSPNATRNTAQFDKIKRKFQAMPRAKSYAEIEKENKAKGGQTGGGQTGDSQMAKGTYKQSVQLPSSSYRVYTNGSLLRMSIPNNWQELPEQDSVFFSPDGAYGQKGITHGAMVGIAPNQNKAALSQASAAYVDGLLQANTYLSRRGNAATGSMAGRQAVAQQLSGTSDVTNRTEVVTVYTALLSDGNLFYFIVVAPENEYATYDKTFKAMRQSIQISDAR